MIYWIWGLLYFSVDGTGFVSISINILIHYTNEPDDGFIDQVQWGGDFPALVI